MATSAIFSFTSCPGVRCLSRAWRLSGRIILSPRARPLGAVLRIDELATEALAELLGVLALGKAEDVRVGSIAIEGMASRAEREVLAEETNGQIVAAGAAVGRERDLMRPVSVNRVYAELASAIAHASPMWFVAARAHADARARTGQRPRSWRRRKSL
jgi:hypothetical protein